MGRQIGQKGTRSPTDDRINNDSSSHLGQLTQRTTTLVIAARSFAMIIGKCSNALLSQQTTRGRYPPGYPFSLPHRTNPAKPGMVAVDWTKSTSTFLTIFVHYILSLLSYCRGGAVWWERWQVKRGVEAGRAKWEGDTKREKNCMRCVRWGEKLKRIFCVRLERARKKKRF